MARRLQDRLLVSVLITTAGAFYGCADPASEVRMQSPRLSPASSSAQPRPPHTRFLPAQIGTRIPGRLGPGEVHTYTVELPAGEYLLVQVEQRGVDVMVSVADPAGRQIVEVDSPNGSRGSEPVPLVTSASGAHRIFVQSLDSGTGGDYELSLVELRPATDRDRRHAQAAILLAEAERLRKQDQAHDTAAELYRQAEGLQHSADATWEETVTLRRLSQLQLARNRPEDALATLSQALALARGLGDPQQEAGIFSFMGQTRERLGRPAYARRDYERAIKVARAGRAPLEEAAAWNNLANLSQEQGELEKALAAYDRALMGWRRNGQKSAEATVLHNLGSLYLDLGRLPEARDCLLQSLTLQTSHGSAETSLQTLTLTVLGQVYSWQEGHRIALSYYRQAMALARGTGDRWAQAILLDKLGSAHLELGDVQHALALQEKAAAIFRELGDQDRLAWVLANLGWLHERQGRSERALHLYREALALFGLLKDRTGEALVSFNEARIARQRGDLEAARSKLELALDRIESLRADAPGPSLRSSFFASRQTYYEKYVDLLMELHRRQPRKGWDTLALEVSERTRARSFLDTLGGARIDLQEHTDRELLRRDRELLNRLDALETERMAGSRRASLERDQRDLLLERETLLARMHDEERRGMPSPAVPLTVAQIRNRVLDPESLLLVYALGDERSFLWLVDGRSVRSFILPGRGRIEPLARTAYELLSQGEGTGMQAKLVLTRLASMILGPTAPHLRRHTSRLLIVADGALRSVPFAALPEPESELPLLTRHELVYLDSPSVLARQRQRLAGRSRAPRELAVVADPVFNQADPRIARSVAGPASVLAADLRRSVGDLGVRSFGRLPESGREAEALLALVPRSQRLAAVGFAANRETVLSGALSRYRIVHFATHGLIHPRHPELSGLVLSLVDDRGRPRDGFLRAYELQKLGLSADLVVLSACRTALGKEVPGEGLVGMTRGLMEAGSPRLVVSLWSVEDRSTAELMRRFYRGMFHGGLRPSAALREAQLSMLREPEWSDPRSWASFLFQGEWH